MCGKAGCYLQIQHSDGTIFSGTWVSNVIVGGGTMTFEVGHGLYDGPTKVSSSIGRGMRPQLLRLCCLICAVP
jgi:hypothetical protein